MFEKRVQLKREELERLLSFIGENPEEHISHYLDPRRQRKDHSTSFSKASYRVFPAVSGVLFRITIVFHEFHSEPDKNRRMVEVSGRDWERVFEKTLPFSS